MKNKKKSSKVFLSNLVEGSHGFFNFFKGGYLHKTLGNPDLNDSFYIHKILIFFVVRCEHFKE